MIRNKLIALVAAGCLTASMGVTSLAFTKNVTSKTNVNFSHVQFKTSAKALAKTSTNSQNDIKSKLDPLVTAGTITHAIEDKVIAIFNQIETDKKAEMDKLKSMSAADRKTYLANQAKTPKVDPLASLVSGGTMTQAQADAIKAAIAPNKDVRSIHRSRPMQPAGKTTVNMQTALKTKLDALVKAGTITQDIEDKVVAYESQQEAARKAEMDKLNSMSAADRKTYLENKAKTPRQDMFTSMVSSGTLTQAQADTLKAAMMPKVPTAADIQASMKTKLDTLVTIGTITQAIEASVISALSQDMADKQADMKKLLSMSKADRQAYLKSQANTTPQDPIAALVTGGTLTQAQADAINKALPFHGGFRGLGGFGGRWFKK